MLPVDFDPKRSHDSKWVFDDWAYPVSRVQDLADLRGVALTIVLLDASWSVDIRKLRTFRDRSSSSPGERRNRVASATQPGEIIDPSSSGNSGGLFTKAVSDNLLQPVASLRILFDKIDREVVRTSDTASILRSAEQFQTVFIRSAQKPDPALRRAVAQYQDHEEYVWIPPAAS